MRIATPPVFSEILLLKKLQELSAQHPPNTVIELMKTFSATDNKGRYLHWNKFRFTYPKHAEVAWLITKSNRKSLLKTLSFAGIDFQFCVPESLQASLHFIDKAAAGNVGTSTLDGITQDTQHTFLVDSLIMEEAITSAQLEGAAVTRRIAQDMLRKNRKPNNKDELMILNNYKLMQEAVRTQKEKMSIETILNFHRIATENAIENNAIPGNFREDNDIYIIGEYDNEILYSPPEHHQVPELMTALCDFINQDHNQDDVNFIHPVIKAIIIHFLIGYIHPFGDGNGRTARALFYWFMLKNGYWLFQYISISRLLKEAPASYCKAYLYTEKDELDMTYFIYYQTDIIKRAIRGLNDYIHRQQKKMSEFITNVLANSNPKLATLDRVQKEILRRAVKHSGQIFSVKEVSIKFSISDNTARKYLTELAEMKLLLPSKSGRTMQYISPNDLLDRLK